MRPDARGARKTEWVGVARYFVQPPLDPDSLEILAWKDTQTNEYRRFVIAGRIWTIAGFEAQGPARAAFHGNALVIERCDESTMDFRVGSPSHRMPYRSIGLAPFGDLGKLDHVRIIATPGRLIITSCAGELGRQCRDENLWPTDSQHVVELVEALAQKRAPHEPSAKEVGCYSVPEGRRLQIQGRWLNQLGFKPGMKFGVTAVDGELRVELGVENGWSVTQHSPGSSKLYVPAQSLELLNADKVRVLGREGVLKLLPLAA